MKKMLMCCGALCLTLLLFCGTALALDPQVTPANGANAQVEKIAKGDDAAFKVTKSDAEKEKLYLIMIQEGDNADAKPKPDKDNLYYLNVEAGSEFPLVAYPKDLKAESSYVVYLSDYSADNNGAAKGIAVISTKTAATPGDNGDSGTTPGGDNGDSNTNPGGNETLVIGDLDRSGELTTDDIGLMVNIVVSGRQWTAYELSVGDLDNSGEIDTNDVGLLLNKYLSSLYS